MGDEGAAAVGHRAGADLIVVIEKAQYCFGMVRCDAKVIFHEIWVARWYFIRAARAADGDRVGREAPEQLRTPAAVGCKLFAVWNLKQKG